MPAKILHLEMLIMTQNTLLQTSIYENLRQQLFQGDIEAGSQLSEQQLADDFNASRMPVRQALARLVHEGLIHQSSRVRSAVINPTLAELEESVELRGLLEPHAAQLAAARMTWLDLEKLSEACKQMTQVAARVRKTKRFDDDDCKAELYADLTFHRTIWQAADRPRLAKTCDDLHLIWRIGAPILDKDPADVSNTLKSAASYHQQIYKAFKDKDSQGAAVHMRQHIESNRLSLSRLARQISPA